MKKGCLNNGCFICIGCFLSLLFILYIYTVYGSNTAITKKFCRIKIRECYYRIQAFEELYGRLPADLNEIPAGIIPSLPPQTGYTVWGPFWLKIWNKFMRFVYIPGKNKNARRVFSGYPLASDTSTFLRSRRLKCPGIDHRGEKKTRPCFIFPTPLF